MKQVLDKPHIIHLIKKDKHNQIAIHLRMFQLILFNNCFVNQIKSSNIAGCHGDCIAIAKINTGYLFKIPLIAF